MTLGLPVLSDHFTEIILLNSQDRKADVADRLLRVVSCRSGGPAEEDGVRDGASSRLQTMSHRCLNGC